MIRNVRAIECWVILFLSLAVPAVAQDKATVFVWKSWHVNTLRRITFDVYLDAKPIAKLDRNRFLVARVTPGKHVFSTKRVSAVELDCEAGRFYYLRMDTSSGVTVGHPVLSHVSEEEGQAAIRQAQFINPSDIIDTSIVSVNYEPLPVSSHLNANKQEAAGKMVSFQVTSEPLGADIFIDGEYKGATPSQLKASPGPHILKISRPGFTDWERKMAVENGTAMTFNAILVKGTQ